MTKFKDIIKPLNELAPIEDSFEKDPVGLQIGNLENDVAKVLITLDVRPEVVQEAIDKNIDLIISHHPLIFRPIKNIDLSNEQNKMYVELIKHNINVFSAHTNLDNAQNGMNQWLAELLDLENIKPVNLSMNLKKGYVKDVPTGRIGNLKKECSLKDFAKICKDKFDIDGLRLISNNLDQQINKVAVLGGDGGKYYPSMQNAGADVYITGDIYYHVGHDILADGFSVIDPGHNIEKVISNRLTKDYLKWKEEYNLDIEIFESKVDTDPYTFI
ncbi:Nif3-like dinuclear metal center hexameric protein [Lactobacillus sp. S2-2]|uniref:Nif3-like dinuclear metal center hexameric protein n=1 Tax=Lactobacillus sp. S2-2 TaxID=2692917 RepID=UPI001F0170CC|nr:Nif3-like dinuclear metal center hexameric protein [Lactobacillus sp. S2-2]MCF6514993.1 Nif3-like dinuclear metal center hexameric protein [Lactobacillus sp. S2-2]